MIQVLLVDDHILVRSGLRTIIEAAETMSIAGEASTGEEALTLIQSTPIDVALIDVHMPGMSVEELIAEVNRVAPNIRCVILTVNTDEVLSSNLLNNGALSYLTKSCSNDILLEAITKAANNERYVTPEMSKQLAYRLLQSKKHEAGGTPFSNLSPREIECLMLMAHGKNTKEISKQLSIHIKTITTYRHRIYQKLDVSNEIDLMRLAARYQLIKNSPD